MSSTDNRTATQRIEDLEKVVTALFQGVSDLMNAGKGLTRLQEDMVLVKESLKLLNKRIEAVILSATPETGVTADAVDALVVKLNVKDMEAQVASFVKNGQLVAAETVADDSYLVCEEQDSTTGVVANPRVQFRLDSIDAAVREALKGKKAGDTVSTGENTLTIKILEVYAFATPANPDAPAAAPAEATAPAAEAAPAPAAEAPAPAAEAPAPAAEAPAPAAEAPAPAELPAAPAETPVAVFVPSGDMLKADGTSTAAAG